MKDEIFGVPELRALADAPEAPPAAAASDLLGAVRDPDVRVALAAIRDLLARDLERAPLCASCGETMPVNRAAIAKELRAVVEALADNDPHAEDKVAELKRQRAARLASGR